MTNTYYAQPYNIDAEGFFFTDYDDYLSKSEGLTDRFGQPVEEFELQFIDGDTFLSRLFHDLLISQGSLKIWFDEFEGLETMQQVAALYLVDMQGYTMEDILACHLDDVFFFDGDAEDYAREEIDSSGALDALPETLQYYFDYEAYACDLVLSGDITEWRCPKGNYYVVRAV